MLSKDQIQQFENEGYLVVEDVLEAEIFESVQVEYHELLNELYSDWHSNGLVPADSELNFYDKLLVSYRAGCEWFQSMDISLPNDTIYDDTPFHFGPAVFDMITSARILDMVEDLIGPEITSNPIQHVRLKPPVSDLNAGEVCSHITATDWHQDRGVALEEGDNTKMITVWLAISDATIQNGCLQVIPGKPKLYPHCPKIQTAIADGILDESSAIPLPVKAGGAVLFHPLTPHSSFDNISGQFRWSFDIRYNITGQPSGRSQFPEFIARSKTNPNSVLTDWKVWRDLWIDARKTLASQIHKPVHRWDTDSPICA